MRAYRAYDAGVKTEFPLRYVNVVLMTLALLAPGGCWFATAQEMHHSAESAPSTRLEVRVQDGETRAWSIAEFKALPHTSVTVLNGHSKVRETYSGVLLSDLLSQVHVPLGEKLRGKLLMTSVVAEGTDGYKVLYSLAEVDPAMHAGNVLVADAVNGAPLNHDGPSNWYRRKTSALRDGCAIWIALL
jgi:hypothetical protein